MSLQSPKPLPDPIKENLAKLRTCVLLTVLLLIPGILWVRYSVQLYQLDSASLRFLPVPGSVVSQGPVRGSSTKGQLRQLVTYQYSVAGRSHQDSSHVGGKYESDFASYRAGAAVTVFHDPDRPAISQLKPPGIGYGDVVLWGGLGLVFSVFGCAGGYGFVICLTERRKLLAAGQTDAAG
jgi:hypothetical protein